MADRGFGWWKINTDSWGDGTRAPAEDEGDDDDDEAEGTPAACQAAKSEGEVWQLQAHWPATSKSSISSIKFDPLGSHNVSGLSSPPCMLSFTTAFPSSVCQDLPLIIISYEFTRTCVISNCTRPTQSDPVRPGSDLQSGQSLDLSLTSGHRSVTNTA